MGFFNRNRGMALPANVVQMMERFGRHELDPANSLDDSSLLWSETQAPMMDLASRDRAGFLAALAQTVVPIGGLAAYGAAQTVWNVAGTKSEGDPSYDAIIDASLEYLRGRGVPPGRLTGLEWDHWLAKGGTKETWIPRIPTPSLGEAPITPLRPGELRRIVQIEAAPDSNVIFVKARDGGGFCSIVEAKHSSDDPTRSQWEGARADSLYDLYVQIGLNMQTPTHWFDPELEPYFPLPASSKA